MGAKILTVDDDVAITDLLTVRLASAGFKTYAANDGEAGLELAKKVLPDLIILDVIMPVIDGYQFCLLLRTDERFRNTPIIMLTSLSNQIDKTTGKAFGAVEYITKPFDSVRLIEAVKKWLPK